MAKRKTEQTSTEPQKALKILLPNSIGIYAVNALHNSGYNAYIEDKGTQYIDRYRALLIVDDLKSFLDLLSRIQKGNYLRLSGRLSAPDTYNSDCDYLLE